MKKKQYLFAGIAALAMAASLFSVNHKRTKRAVKLVKVKAPKIPDVTLVGPIVMADGIGRQTAELAAAITNDFQVQIISNYVDPTDLPPAVHSILHTQYDQLGKMVICEESLWDPSSKIERFFGNVTKEGQIRIAYSMLESSRIPPEWAMQLNLYFDAVVVPDPFLIEVYRESGVTIPIFEIPLALDLEPFLAEPLKQRAKSPMVFANLSTCLDRKNQLLLIRAFAKALGNNEGAVLKINCRSGDHETIQEISDEILKLNCSNIQLTHICLKKDAYLKLFQSVDCYVSLSKGEGFSIQPREAMALGIPVILSNNTAQSTICKSGLVKSVKSEIVEPAHYFKSRFKSGYRFNCELDSVVDAIKDVYLNYNQYLDKGAEARKWAKQYSYSNHGLTNLYRSLIYPKKVLFGFENKVTEEYVMTDSEELYQKYNKLTQEWNSNGTQQQALQALLAKNKAKKARKKSRRYKI